MRFPRHTPVLWVCAALVLLLGGLVRLAFGPSAGQDGNPAAGTSNHNASGTSLANLPNSSSLQEKTTTRNFREAKAPSEMTDDELKAEAMTRIGRSGPEALAWAKAQTDPAQRERVIAATLRAWSELDPRAALEWLRSHDDLGESAWQAAFIGASRQPGVLLEIARGWLAADPAKGSIQGAILLSALASAGNYSLAADFARGAPQELRDDWIKAAFRRWAEYSPEEAAQSLAGFGNDPARSTAFPALVEGWAAKSPGGLATYALTLPAGDSRGFALGEAMLKWCEQDPASLAAWLPNVKSRSEYDLGAMLLVTQTDRANRSTDLALRWTESIADPALKRESLQHVLTEWLQVDPIAARVYVERSSWLSPAEQNSLLQAAIPRPDEP